MEPPFLVSKMNVLLSKLVFLYPKIAIFYFYVKKNNKIRYYIKDLLSLPKDNKYGTF